MLRIANKIKNGECPIMVFFGDSVTQGCFEFENGYKGTATRPEQAYHSLLKERIKKELGKDITVVNAGIAGNFSWQGLERIQTDVLDKKPDFCCVMFGTNDVTAGKKGLEKYERSMRTIFQKLHDNGIEAVLLTPGMLASRLVKGFRGFWWIVHLYYQHLQKSGMMDRYVERARKVAREMKVPIADAYTEWKRLESEGVDTTAMLINGLNHPAPEYHKIFADKLFELIFGDCAEQMTR